MIIARQKRKENIAEYLLYMWQVEDLIRANKFDMDSINRTVIAHYDQPEEVKKEIAQWYEELIEMMRSEGVMEKGHIQLNKNVIITLTDLHLRLLKSPKDHEQHHDRHDTVEEPVKVHQLRQPMLIILRSRLIQAVYHRRADAKLCKVQDAQHIGEQSVDTQICRRQIVDEHHPADEQQHLIHELSTHIDDHIDKGIPCPHFSYVPSFSSVARCIRCNRVHRDPVRYSLL